MRGGKLILIAMVGLALGGAAIGMNWRRLSWLSVDGIQGGQQSLTTAKRAIGGTARGVALAPGANGRAQDAPPALPEPPSGGIFIPGADDASMKRMAEAVALTPTQEQRVQGLMMTLGRARALVEKYPAESREKKRAQLDRQTYMALLTAVSSEQWPLMDRYLARRGSL